MLLRLNFDQCYFIVTVFRGRVDHFTVQSTNTFCQFLIFLNQGLNLNVENNSNTTRSDLVVITNSNGTFSKHYRWF